MTPPESPDSAPAKRRRHAEISRYRAGSAAGDPLGWAIAGRWRSPNLSVVKNQSTAQLRGDPVNTSSSGRNLRVIARPFPAAAGNNVGSAINGTLGLPRAPVDQVGTIAHRSRAGVMIFKLDVERRGAQPVRSSAEITRCCGSNPKR